MSGINEGKKNVFGDTVNVDNVDNVVKSLSIDHIGFVQLFPNHHNIVSDISYSIGSSKDLPNGVNIPQNIICGNELDDNQLTCEIRTTGAMQIEDANEEREQESMPAKVNGTSVPQVSMNTKDFTIVPYLTSCVVNNVENQNDWIDEMSDVAESLNSNSSVETDFVNIVDLFCF
jgi:hypothetical protein